MNWFHFHLGRPRPLRFHFALLVCGVLFPVVAFSVVVVRQLAASEKQAAEGGLLQSAHDFAASVDRELVGTIRALQILGTAESLDRNDTSQFHDEATRLLNTQPLWHSIILVNYDGKPLMNTRYPPTATLPPLVEPESFQEVVETKAPVVGRISKDTTGELAFPVRVPIVQEGQLRYVLTVVMRPAALNSLVARSVYASEWTRAIVDSKGIVVARTRDPERFVGQPVTPTFWKEVNTFQEAAYRDTTLDGMSSIVAFSHVPIADWVVGVAVPVEVIDGPSYRFLLTATIVGSSLLIASGIGAFVLTRRVSRGINEAVAAADTLSLGRRPIDPQSGVAEIKRLHLALHQSANLLDQREDERQQHLDRAQKALAEAEQANRAKDEFLAMLGHELRNPLGPLRNSVHLLGRILPDDDKDVAAVREIMDRQVTHMTRLVDDLLDASRVVRGTMQIQSAPLELSSVIADVVSDYRAQFQTAGILLTLDRPDEPVMIEGDRIRLAQCAGNLLHNALKFTPNGGEVRVRLAREGNNALLVIRDTGPGIPPDLLPRLFDPFAQGPQSLARIQGGLGLGLALVKGFIGLHGGTVEVCNIDLHDGGGARFTIRLPLTIRSPEVASSDDRSPALTGSRQRVLVVEDLPDAARSLKMLLTLDGHDVAIADSAAAALEVAPKQKPSVIICDIGLPDMDGYTLCQKLKTLPELSRTRLIALTGYGQASDVTRALEAGFDLHLTKPVDVPALRDAVQPATHINAVINAEVTL